MHRLQYLKLALLLCYRLAPEYFMTTLKEQEANNVWAHWNMNTLDSLASIRHFITAFPSAAIHTHSPLKHQQAQEGMQCTNTPHSLWEGAEKTLVSWVHLFRLGWMGNTFTLPQHRRRGLARATTLALAQKLLSEALLPYVLIDETNHGSIKLHEDLGFCKQCPIHLVLVMPDQ